MKYIGIILILASVLVLPAIAGGRSEAPSSEISGKIEGGLRILNVPQDAKELEYNIYRGDYIVFEFEKPGSYPFSVPELEIDSVMPMPEGETPYVKMKSSGDFRFTLGDASGIMHVKELVDANYHELSAEEASELIKNVSPLILDVRSPAEYESGHIDNSKLLPVQVFAENIGSLEQYKDEDILVYCASGNRSTVAARMLIDAGFTKVYNLRHGIGDWMRSGKPIVQ